MDSTGIRNFKDFMLLYNITTETCFNQCVNNFYSRKLYDDEATCTDKCAGKYINFLNKVLGCYVTAQQAIVAKRIAEMEAQQPQ